MGMGMGGMGGGGTVIVANQQPRPFGGQGIVIGSSQPMPYNGANGQIMVNYQQPGYAPPAQPYGGY